MQQMRLDVDDLEVTTFEPDSYMDEVITGGSNSRAPACTGCTKCNWTE
ncbi:MAG TPA: hypothetical protein VHG91_02475 [Longimicrobium sp.]|nr:hypothetical protein [Longimicrobium sp.]